MCGIAGIVCRDPEIVQRALSKMNGAQMHRGPDAEGMQVYPFGNHWLGLGQRRLAIIDLSPLGHQPMVATDQSCSITFNGEIYNFRKLRAELQGRGISFRSHSDTEVLLEGLRLEGASFVEKLEGMYAFAFFDHRSQRLTLARDPIGIKPLYYTASDDHWIFASEVRAILATGMVSREIDREAMEGYLAYGAVPQPYTLFAKIRMLEPGTVVELAPHRESVTKLHSKRLWWSIPKPTRECSREEAIEGTRERLTQAVQDHLIADVPVGVFLSAGIDSTILASMAHGMSKEVKAFTVSLAEDAALDEIQIAAETAKRIGMEHVPVVVSDRDAESAALRWLEETDQPSIDGLNTFIISQAIRKQGIKVALSGLGADELFGGYPSFQDVPKLVTFMRATRWMPSSWRKKLGNWIQRPASWEAKQKLFDTLDSAAHPDWLTLQRRRLLNNAQLHSLGFPLRITDPLHLRLPKESIERLGGEKEVRWCISRVESEYYQRNMLLRDSDANSMTHSLELRVPFLDQKLLNWVPSLPDAVRFPEPNVGKSLLRLAAKSHLQSVHLRRPKTGFVLPLHRWMKGILREQIQKGLESLAERGVGTKEGLRNWWGEFEKTTHSNGAGRVLALASMGHFLRNYG